MGGGTALNPLCHATPRALGCSDDSPMGYNYDPELGKCVPYCLANSAFTSLETCQSACQPQSGAGGSGGTSATEVLLSVDPSGHVTSSAALGISGPSYPYSDGAGTDGVRANGDCERAGHSETECAKVVTPSYSAVGVVDWSVGGLLCTSGTAERVLDVVGMPGEPDYAHMWGAGLGFNFSDSNPAYDASAHGVIGIAFDLDESSMPPVGMRIELPTVTTVDEPRVWKPAPLTDQFWTDPLQPGHNVVLFQDVAPLTFYTDRSAFDPTQILSVQFHVPTTNVSSNYAFCIHNLSLVLGTPPTPVDPGEGACPVTLETDTGFAYNAGGACVSPNSTVLGCSLLDNPDMVVPATPVIPNLPCVRRLFDGALYIAIGAGGAHALDWQTLPPSAWTHLSPNEWAECNADEAALVAAAPLCPILPL